MRSRTLTHPVTRDRLVVLVAAEDSAGELFRFEYVARAATEAPPDHVHGIQEERIAVLDGSLCSTESIGGTAVATVGSTASNTPPHIPTPPGASFQKPPGNKATVQMGSATVTIGGQPAARTGDTAMTCNDPADAPVGTVVAAGTVMVGG